MSMVPACRYEQLHQPALEPDPARAAAQLEGSGVGAEAHGRTRLSETRE
jgi:hypothetical protein